jgi:hypothetical protein
MPALLLGLTQIGAVFGALELDSALHVGVIGGDVDIPGGSILSNSARSQRQESHCKNDAGSGHISLLRW